MFYTSHIYKILRYNQGFSEERKPGIRVNLSTVGPYKNCLNNILDSNFDNIIAKMVNTKPRQLRKNLSIT